MRNKFKLIREAGIEKVSPLSLKIVDVTLTEEYSGCVSLKGSADIDVWHTKAHTLKTKGEAIKVARLLEKVPRMVELLTLAKDVKSMDRKLDVDIDSFLQELKEI